MSKVPDTAGGCGNCQWVFSLVLADGTKLDTFLCGHGSKPLIRAVSTTLDGEVNVASADQVQTLTKTEDGRLLFEVAVLDENQVVDDLEMHDMWLNGKKIGSGDALDEDELRRWM